VLTLILATAAVLGVALIAFLVAVLVFLFGIRRLVGETHAALLVASGGAGQLAARLDEVHRAAAAAVRELRAERD
jgi:hypothetical protein